MKITKLISKNILNLKAVEIDTDGNMMIISGKNEAGKTSVLESIFMALTGKLPKKPIREGEETGIIKINTDTNLTITKTIVKHADSFKTSLKIENSEGLVYTKPQQMLNSIIGELTFDPLKFANMRPAEQRGLLLEIMGVDLDAIESKKKSVYDERTAVNRQYNDFTSQLKFLDTDSFSNIDDEGVDTKKLARDLNIVNEQIRNAEIANKEHFYAKRTLSEFEDKIKKMQIHLEECKKNVENTIKYCVNTEPLEIQKKEILTKIESASEINSLINTKKEYQKTLENEARLKKASDNLTKELKNIDSEKVKLIGESNLPVPGLLVFESGVMLNNIPFDQLSSAQKLKISMRLAIAMNPKLRIIKINDGSLLDKNSMKIIEEIAIQQDFQIWIEIVDETGDLGIYIEDGNIPKKKMD